MTLSIGPYSQLNRANPTAGIATNPAAATPADTDAQTTQAAKPSAQTHGACFGKIIVRGKTLSKRPVAETPHHGTASDSTISKSLIDVGSEAGEFKGGSGRDTFEAVMPHEIDRLVSCAILQWDVMLRHGRCKASPSN